MTFGPVGPIIATLITALLSAGIALFITQKRQRVDFFVGATEDLTLALRRNRPNVSVKVDDKELLNLNRAIVAVRSSGNDVIKDFVFEIRVEGKHDFFVADIRSQRVELKNSCALQQRHDTKADAAIVTVPFLNPKEAFSVTILVEGVSHKLDVRFRMAGVKARWKLSPSSAFGPELIAALARQNIIFELLSRRS